MRIVVPLFFPAVGPLRTLCGVVPFERRSAFVAPRLIAVPVIVHLTNRENTLMRQGFGI